MFYAVYQLYERGQQLNPEFVKTQPPLSGHLELRRRFFNSTDRSNVAVLAGADGKQLLPSLFYAVVVRVKDGTLLIDGTESVTRRENYKSKCDYYPQRWLCKLASHVEATASKGKSPDRFLVDPVRSAAQLVSGFDPMDDDRC